jgi:hypothetical protein
LERNTRIMRQQKKRSKVKKKENDWIFFCDPIPSRDKKKASQANKKKKKGEKPAINYQSQKKERKKHRLPRLRRKEKQVRSK